MNLSAIANYTTSASALANLVLATPQSTKGYQPQNPPLFGGALNNFLQPNPPAFMFHYEGEQTVSLESDITDHFVENNTAIQDQIALRPEIITTHGFIGELNNVPPASPNALQNVTDKLQTISAYVPALTTAASINYAQAVTTGQISTNALNAGVAAWSSLSGAGGTSVINGTSLFPASNQNKQQTAFQTFYGYWRNRVLFTIQTPWAVFQNCAIYKLRAIQSEETRMISDFEVTFKLIRMASTTTSKVQAGRLNEQASGLINQGVQTVSKIATTLTGFLGGAR
jgi:hypothetical protein